MSLSRGAVARQPDRQGRSSLVSSTGGNGGNRMAGNGAAGQTTTGGGSGGALDVDGCQPLHPCDGAMMLDVNGAPTCYGVSATEGVNNVFMEGSSLTDAGEQTVSRFTAIPVPQPGPTAYTCGVDGGPCPER